MNLKISPQSRVPGQIDMTLLGKSCLRKHQKTSKGIWKLKFVKVGTKLLIFLNPYAFDSQPYLSNPLITKDDTINR